MRKEILTKSDKFTSEYCCSIIRLGEIKPIEGKDKIGYTLANGETIVVRKDQVKEGDIVFYASNETQLNNAFLSVNNLFEDSTLNANSSEVEPVILENKKAKFLAEEFESKVARFRSMSHFFLTYQANMAIADSDDKKELEEKYQKYRKEIIAEAGSAESDSINGYISSAKYIKSKFEAEIDLLNKKIAENSEFIRHNTGFFNKNCRVRAVRLGGIRSMGYLFTLDELAKYNPKVKDINLEDLIGEDFDTVDGELFVKAYVPFVPEKNKSKGKNNRLNKKIDKFDRMIKGEFFFHYSSDPLAKCISRIKPTDIVSISVKVHGTSAVCGKLHVKKPIKLPIHKRCWNKFIDMTHLFKGIRFTDYTVEYGNVTSSRTVIKNQYINKGATEGFYGVDIWSEYGDILYPYIDEGMTIYGEIFGYLTNSEKMIQKGYDYGCECGKNKFMPYRITTTNTDGTKYEWEVSEVKEWTLRLVKEHPELADRIHVIDLLYHGTLIDLYPHLSLTDHWHENVLEELRNDVKHFGMEKNEPLCKYHKVPREGICLRIDHDTINENFKLKTQKFFDREQKSIDNGEIDIEMENNDNYTLN